MTTTKQYDFLNRLQSISSAPSATNTAAFYYGYLYNDANQRTRMTTADGGYWVYKYDALGQVTSGKKYWSDGTPYEGLQNEYTYDDIGNRKTLKEGGDQHGLNLRSSSWTNNTLNQLTSRGVPSAIDVIGSSSATNTVTVNLTSASYRRGNYFRHELSVTNTSAPDYHAISVAADTTKTGAVLVAKAPQTFSYDADGNLTNDLSWTYVWDAENRLLSMESLSTVANPGRMRLDFSYDTQGRRTRKLVKSVWGGSAYSNTNNVKFLCDGWNIIGEADGSGSVYRGYLWGTDLSGSMQGAGGVGGLISLKDKTNERHFYAIDGNGNIMGLVHGGSGTVSAQYEYDAFGNSVRANGTMLGVNRFGFSTKVRDETGLLYYGLRYYSTISRWISRDPLGESASLSLYIGNYNDSINHCDFLGLDTEWESSGVNLKGTPGASYDIYSTFSDSNCSLTMKVKLQFTSLDDKARQQKDTLRANWISAFNAKYSRWLAVSPCCSECPDGIKLNFIWEEDPYGDVVELRSGHGRSYSNRWYIWGQWTGLGNDEFLKPPYLTMLHEVSHHFGLVDEYFDRDYPKRVVPSDADTSLMGNIFNPEAEVKARHIQQILENAEVDEHLPCVNFSVKKL